MNIKTRSIIVFISCGLFACESGKQIIRGETGELSTRKVYLSEITRDHWNRHRVIDSADVINGKFIFEREYVKPELYLLGDSPNRGGYFFLDGKNIKIKPEEVTKENILWKVEGSPMDQKYRVFMERWNKATYKRICDSLDQCFFAARDAEDWQEVERIKNESMPYYDEGDARGAVLVNELLEKNKENPFGAYLYYEKRLRGKDFPRLEDVAVEKAYVRGFGEAAKDTRYFTWITEQLDIHEKCAIGHEAPEVVGQDTAGNVVRLSDFRGNYVLVDFWDSYCSWCREETPALKRALAYFKDKKFKILGVSSDQEKERWVQAINEDGSYWNQLLLDKKSDVMDRYCIREIPHIILVGPDGKILAKELRGEDFIHVTKKFME